MSNPPFTYHKRSYFPEETQRQIYLLLCQCVPSTEIARRFSISVETVHSFRKRFGITTHYGRHWTQQEDWELRNLVDQNLSIDIIAKKLHRTVQAVQKRLNDHDIQRIHRNNSVYTVAQVGRILQVGIYCITRWIDHGLLKAKRIPRRKDKKSQSPRSFYRIDSLDLYDFLADPRHWHLYRVADITDEFLRRDLVGVHRETPRWWYINDVAERYGVSLGGVRHWCNLGRIPYELIVRTYVFDPAKLVDWVPPYKSSTPYKYGSRVLKRALAAYPDLLTAKQVAERYGYTVGTINEWSLIGVIPYCAQVGRYRLYDPEQLANWTPPTRAMDSIAVRAALAERPELLTINQLAERFGVDREIAYYWYTRGWITAIKVGKVLMFEPEQFIDWEPPYVRRRKNAAYRPAENGDRPGDDRADDGRRLAGGGATGEWAAETRSQPGGGCESSALPELAQEAA